MPKRGRLPPSTSSSPGTDANRRRVRSSPTGSDSPRRTRGREIGPEPQPAPRTSGTATSACSVTTPGWHISSTGWSPTAPVWSPHSRRPSRICSRGAWSGRCSPPRPWRSGSTCLRSGHARIALQVHRGGPRALQPGDAWQLTGRAGRARDRPAGYGVVLHSPYVRFDQVAEIAAARSPSWCRASGPPTTWRPTLVSITPANKRKNCWPPPRLIPAEEASIRHGRRDRRP